MIGPRRQRGVATLMVTLVVLVILTIIVLSSANVALFEQKTATNENRQRLADQAAEYALGLGGEFLKANIVNIASEQTDGWLASATSRWAQCSLATMTPTHPCMSEPTASRRAEMYYYKVGTSATSMEVPYNSLIVAGSGIANMGGTAAFPATATVNALLCRLDTTVVDAADADGDGNTTEIMPACRATPDPDSYNRIAVTLIARSNLTDENATGAVKETWANFDTFSSSAAVPLIASGSVDITGNVEIVTAPNGGGTGIPVSIWTPLDADVDCSGGGSCASISTCQLGEFLNGNDESTFKTVCPTSSGAGACQCPAVANASSPEEAYAQNPNLLSGKIPSASPNCCENIDILDRDSGVGVSPDIQFYPGGGIDDFADQSDDTLFEWVFGVSNEANTTRPNATTAGTGTGPTLLNCGAATNENCAIWNLTEPDQLNATSVTCAELNALGANAAGLYYVTDSGSALCTLPSQVGTPDATAIVVLDEQCRINGTLFYGLLFVRSDDKTAELTFTGNADIYGALVVEGEATGHGNVTLVYLDTSAGGPGDKLPVSTRLGRVSGSWLDNTRGGF
jgi:Tfp pilus assembly protein PilX